MPKSPAAKAYAKRVIWLSLQYVVYLMTAIYAFKHQLVTGPLSVLVALLPAVPIVGIFFAIGRFILDEKDEYQRMLLIRQTLWATGFALSIATFWGFLENFQIVDHVESYWVAVLWFAGLGFGACMNKFGPWRAA